MDFNTVIIPGLCALGGYFLAFITKDRQQTSAVWGKIVAQQGDAMNIQDQRINTLEMRIEEIHREHVECLKDRAEDRARIAALETVND